MKEERFTIWWKLTPLAAVLTVLTWVVLTYIRFESPEISLWMLIPLYCGLILPNVYLSTFALWHWKTRYRGRWPFAWAIAFVLWWAYLPGLMYFASYILPELRGRDPYTKSPEVLVPASSLPKKYRYLKSAFFVIGLSLVIWGLSSTVLLAFAHGAFSDVLMERIPRSAPEDMTERMASAMLMVFKSFAIMFNTLAIAALSASVGAILLFLSQRMRWRLLDEKEKEDI